MLKFKACKWHIIALTLLLTLSNGLNAQNDIDSEHFFSKGYQSLSNNSEMAIKAFSRSIQLDSNYSEAFYQRGIAYLKLGDYQNALHDFLHTNKSASTNNYDIYTAFAFQGTGKLDSAKIFFYRYISKHPQDTAAYFYVLSGTAPHETGHFKPQSLIDMSIELQPLHEKFQYYRYLQLDRAGLYEEALGAINELIRLRPSFYLYYIYKGDELYSLKQYNEAIFMYNIAAMKKAEDDSIYYKRGKTYQKLENCDKAMSDFDQAIKLNSTVGSYFAKKAECLMTLGYKEKACDNWLKANQLGHETSSEDNLPNCDFYDK
ncbi:tetratricopeptide repeat protein [Fulvivirga sediminis]|uniref:Tetratricopeptide repeat protein n=1 Tax=Fulvivirga sediminis TaxID=2803949 RepID=A0A937JZH3_9BACT|nr:tetratricopeptide repeat protein [Fulvivirga sediminis]MBL3655285.1 tetratricopeptide repeat protein [Fulvivirga sediminis]